MTDPAPRCSSAARERDDQLFATASRVQNWVLVEQPGAWGTDALFQCGIPATVAEEMHRRGDGLRIRVILLRRPGSSPDRRTAYFAHTGTFGTKPFLERATFEDPAELLDVDWRPMREGRMVGMGQEVNEPLFLVCTNGRHDVCCAERGRPLYREVAEEFPEATWECSHIGGDRFAANLVCFPHGVYYGWVEPGAGQRLAGAYSEGLLGLELYRGRSSYQFDVQAAEFFLRRSEGMTRIDDVVVDGRRRRGDESSVVFVSPVGSHLVRVQRTHGPAARLTCRAGGEARPRLYRLLSIEST